MTVVEWAHLINQNKCEKLLNYLKIDQHFCVIWGSSGDPS